MNDKNLSSKLTELSHNLFTLPEYKLWRDELSKRKRDHWFSLIVELDRLQIPIEKLKDFGEDVYSKLVFRCIEAPTFKNTNQLMVLFSLADASWHSLVYQTECVEKEK